MLCSFFAIGPPPTKCLVEGFEVILRLNPEETKEFKQWRIQFDNDSKGLFGVRTLLHEACHVRFGGLRFNFGFCDFGRRQSQMIFVQLFFY